MTREARQLAAAYEAAGPAERAELIARLEADPRKWAQTLAARWKRQAAAEASEAARLDALSRHEQQLWKAGIQHVAGVAEAGRSAVAGPLVAAAVILPAGRTIPGIKQPGAIRKPGELAALSEAIQESAVAWAITRMEPTEIDQLNLAQATAAVMTEAVRQLAVQPAALLRHHIPLRGLSTTRQHVVGGGAEESISILAAAVLAEWERRQIMQQLAQDYPGYDLELNLGEATRDHVQTIVETGPSPVHRQSLIRRLLRQH